MSGCGAWGEKPTRQKLTLESGCPMIHSQLPAAGALLSPTAPPSLIPPPNLSAKVSLTASGFHKRCCEGKSQQTRRVSVLYFGLKYSGVKGK